MAHDEKTRKRKVSILAIARQTINDLEGVSFFRRPPFFLILDGDQKACASIRKKTNSCGNLFGIPVSAINRPVFVRLFG